MRHFEHIPRETIDRETIDRLRPALLLVLHKTAQNVRLAETAWYLCARAQDDHLYFLLWYGQVKGPAHVSQAVQQRDPPRLVLPDINPSFALSNPTAAAEAGDLGRCLAWTWLAIHREAKDDK